MKNKLLRTRVLAKNLATITSAAASAACPLVLPLVLPATAGWAQTNTGKAAYFTAQDYQVSSRPLNLNRVPTERELRALGGIGGPLCPLDNATPERVAPLLGAKGVNAKIIAVQTERLQAINLDYGKALMVLKIHDFEQVLARFEQHLKEFPDSPWAGEIMLHLGKAAAGEGRYSEAEERYASILEVTSEDPSHPTFDLTQKTKMAWANLDISLGKWNGAKAKLQNILRTDKNWQRVSWAQAYLQKIAVSSRSLNLQACGSQALAVVLADTGHKSAAAKVRTLNAPREAGFSLAELQGIAKKNGVAMSGVRATVEDLGSMPLPLLVHYDFNASAERKVAAEPHCEHCIPTNKAVVSRPRLARKAHALPAAFQLRDEKQAGGHFLIVRQVDSRRRQVSVFNPLDKTSRQLSFVQFAKEWSGAGLMLSRPLVAQKPGIHPVSVSSQPKTSGLKLLSMAEMSRVRGGCCCVGNSLTSEMGENESNEDIDSPSNCGDGAPSLSVNKANLNLFLKDTPIWYESPLGYRVGLTMYYNSSSDRPATNNLFGAKWSCIADSYLTANSSLQVNVFMGDGRQVTFSRTNTSQPFKGEPGVFDIVKLNTNGSYTLFLAAGGRHVFAQSGTDTEFRLRESYDIFNNRQLYIRDANTRLTQIVEGLASDTGPTYANSRKLTFAYNTALPLTNPQSRMPIEVEDPYGRVASFKYTTVSSMPELEYAGDMAGVTTRYLYSGTTADALRINELRVAANLTDAMSTNTTKWKSWKFYHEMPNFAASVYYPAPTASMGSNSRLTITDPENNSEEYFFDDSHADTHDTSGMVWHIDKESYVGYPNNGLNTTPKTAYKLETLAVDNETHITGIIEPKESPSDTSISQSIVYDSTFGFPVQTTDANGEIRKVTYNSYGQITQVFDVKPDAPTTWVPEWTYEYDSTITVDQTRAAPMPDLLRIKNRKGEIVTEFYNYGGAHIPEVTWYGEEPTGTGGTRPYYTIRKIYTTWGAISQIDKFVGYINYADPSNNYERVRYNYDTALGTRRLLSVDKYDFTGAAWRTMVSYEYENQYNAGSPIACAYRASRVTDTLGRQSVFIYDNLDRVTTALRPFDNTRETYTYCSTCGQVINQTDRAGRTTTFTRDKLGRLLTTTDSDNRTTQNVLDKDGRLIAFIDAAGNRTEWDYYNRGQVKTKRYPDNTPTVLTDNLHEDYIYDKNGQLAKFRKPDGRVAHYTYYDNGQLSQIGFSNTTAATPAPVMATEMFYDDLGHMDLIYNATYNTSIRFYYDRLGRLQGQTSGAGRMERVFEGDRLDKIEKVGYAYNPTTGVTTRSVLDNYSVDYDYDGLNRLKFVTSDAGQFSYQYNPALVGYSGLPHAIFWPETTTGVSAGRVDFQYDGLGRLTNTTSKRSDGTVMAQFGYAYQPAVLVGGIPRTRDLRSSMTRQVRFNGVLPALQTVTYNYETDSSGNLLGTDRLKTETANTAIPPVTGYYEYTSTGNRKYFLNSGGQVSAQYEPFQSGPQSPLNKLSQVKNYSTSPSTMLTSRVDYVHDENGNPESATTAVGTGENTSYVFDDFDHLKTIVRTTNAVTPVNVARTRFEYDPLGRMTRWIEETWSGTAWTIATNREYAYVGSNPVQEYNVNSNRTTNYTWGMGMPGGGGGMLAQSIGDGAGGWRHSILTYDGAGNVAQMLKKNDQDVLARYTYDAYGNVTTSIAAGLDSIDNARANQFFRYQTKWRHNNTNLVNFGARFYSPSLGRWLSRDPMGEAGGLNLYEYCNGDPVNTIDPDGRWGIKFGHWRNIGFGDPTFEFNRSSAANFGHDLGCGWYAGADGMNPLGDPYKDMGYYNPNSYNAKWSHGLGEVAFNATTAAVPLAPFTTAGGRAIFYSGSGTLAEARLAAQAGRGTLLEGTTGGKILNWADDLRFARKGKHLPSWVWNYPSSAFAMNAKSASAFLNSPAQRSIWIRFEQKILTVRGIAY